MAQRKGISTGTTAQRTIEEAGKMRFNTSTNLLEYYDGNNWKSIDSPPTVSSVDVTDVASGAGGNQTFVITGSNFSTTISSVIFTATSGSNITASSVTRDSSTQITVVEAKSSFVNANEPYGIKVTNVSGLSGELASQINVDSAPVWQTSAGSLATIYDVNRTFSTEVSAHDAESDAITYTVQSGSLPSGLSLTSTSSGAVISGVANSVGSNTTSTFTLRATAGSKTADREYTITVNAPVRQSFTSSGTFSVPSGVTAVDVLVVAGGGGGGTHHASGGGAGGLIYRPAFTVSPGSTVTVTVGDGGGQTNNYPAPDNPSGQAGSDGQDSVFGTLTAKGGGGGGFAGSRTGRAGGSSGGFAAPGGTNSQPNNATQPTQPGDSGNYGFGNPGGGNVGCAAGGGGGAGAAGGNGQPGNGGPGGVGKAYTIADGTTSVYYAGGGGGSWYPTNAPGGQGGQGGGGDGGKQNQDNFPSRGGTANRGGGGGGADRGPGPEGAGGGGGKGIVIVSY